MRTIDADALFAEFENVGWYDNADRDEIAERLVLQAPTIDAVNVVRCKECKFSEVWESTAGNELYCEKQRVCPYDWGTLTAFYVKADDFCSYGERKGEVSDD